jgi:uncharacterized membrane protein YkoI
MKKLSVFFLLVTLILMSSLGGVMAAHDGVGANVDVNVDIVNGDNDSNIEEDNFNKEKMKNFGQERVQVQIQDMSKDRKRIHAGNFSAQTGLNISQEKKKNQTRIYAQNSNGENFEIMIFPDTASEIARERLRLRVCSEENNCTLELKEVGQGNQTRFAYEVSVREKVRLLGFIRTNMEMESQINAETGEVMSIRKPWWAFLAVESNG